MTKNSETHEGNNANTLLCAGNFHPHKYWECECCGLLISMPHQDSVNKYDCPACKVSKCEHGGKFIEITLQEFCRNVNIVAFTLKNKWNNETDK